MTAPMIVRTVFLVSLAQIGVPLLGWGLDDPRGFFVDPARALYCIVAFVGAIAAIFLGPRVPAGGMSKGDESKLVRRQSVALLATRVLVVGALLGMPYLDRHGIAVIEVDWLRYVGVALLAAGSALMYWSTWVLGKQFSVEVTIQEDHELVTSGPYSRIRHPRYLGLLVFALGMALLFRSWAGLGALGLLALIILTRVVDEDRLLHREFGEQWESYRERSWKLLPPVY